MKRPIGIICLLGLPILLLAQQRQTPLDSLRFALINATNDTMHMNACMNMAGYYAEINRDSSLLYSAQGLSLAQKLKFKFRESGILAGRGFVFTNMGNYPEALESLYQALKIAEVPAIEKGTLQLTEGQSPEKARLNLLGRIHLTMGHLYGATGNNYKKISEYLVAIDYADSVQNGGLKITATMNLGNAYYKLNKLDSALLYEQRAISMISNRPAGHERYDGFAFELLARIYQSKGDFTLSKEAYEKSITLSKEKNNLSGLARTLNLFGEFYRIIKKPDSVVHYAREALRVAEITALPVEIKNAYKLLSDIYSDENDRDSTLAYLKLYTVLNDSLNKIEKENLLAYQNIGFDEQLRVKKLEEEKIQTKTKTRTNALLAGLGVFLVIGLILYRNNRQKQKANKVLEKTLAHLKATQAQLIQSEKMASLGELTAGIAHEIQNPLNFVNNFSEVNKELIEELEEEWRRETEGKKDPGEIQLIHTIKENQDKILQHGKRADAIVKGMLAHSRTSAGEKVPVDINTLADECLRLSYHGLRAKDKNFNADYKTDFDPNLPKVNVIPQDIARVLLNLINNAFHAVNGFGEKPTVTVSTRRLDACIQISVSDSGPGIPDAIKGKIFQPFFTTKPTGQGTGLGLSLSYDIVKGHGGEISVLSEAEKGSTFTIQLPIYS